MEKDDLGAGVLPELRSGFFDARQIEDPERAEHPAYVYWKERGGTPYGLDPELAPIPISPGMRFWLRLDIELTGGADDGGCHFRPSEVDAKLDRPEIEEELLSWCEAFVGEPVELNLGKAWARQLLREIGSGRAAARNEMSQKSGASTSDPMSKMNKLKGQATE